MKAPKFLLGQPVIAQTSDTILGITDMPKIVGRITAIIYGENLKNEPYIYSINDRWAAYENDVEAWRDGLFK